MKLDELAILNNQDFLKGGGEMGRLIRSFDWSATPLGPVQDWPSSLKTCIRIILTSRQPMFVWWGPQLINIYNDAYIDIVRGKHPQALGQPASEVWKEIWDQVGPRAETAIQRNEGTYDEALLLIMERNGYPEETYYTFSYSPVPGEKGGAEGIICANTDDTQRIIGERQLRTLKDLGKNIIDCKTNREVYQKTIEVLQDNMQDFPFAIIYELKNESAFRLAGKTSAELPPSIVPEEIDIDDQHIVWPLKEVATSGRYQVMDNQIDKKVPLPSGAWSQPPLRSLVIPVAQSGQKLPYAVLIIGLNRYRLIDEKYIGFFQLITDQIATSLNNIYAYLEEKRRTEALLEIDRAKTTFFSNISHEFRTPLTLMLSPINEVLENKEELPERTKENIEVAHRNALRLLKLVNTLLDFSRIEAGKMQATYENTDITTFTKDLASTFRSAIERSGINYIVRCEPVDGHVYLDPTMWEKIVFNLLSNAFKYTVKGTITLELKKMGDSIRLSVSDTGVGIPKSEKTRIFERFHRIQNVQGRSQEGTGIGLSLVQELVKLHHGTIHVDSEEGQGSTFTIVLPVGKDHLPADKIRERAGYYNSVSAKAFVQEASRWSLGEELITEGTEDLTEREESSHDKPFVILADDNADMRDYIRRLLEKKYEVAVVENGKKALQKMDERLPALIVSDVMMPEMDGFELVKVIKGSIKTAHIPVILLSARAGEEATVEGLQTGADDYLVKPFSAKELISRIESNIKIAKARAGAEKKLSDLFIKAPVPIIILRGPELLVELVNEPYLEMVGRTADQLRGKSLFQGIPELKGQEIERILYQTYISHAPYYGTEYPVEITRNEQKEMRYYNFVYQPLNEGDVNTNGIMVVANDVTEQVMARIKVEEAEARLRLTAEGNNLGVWDLDLQAMKIIHSPRLSVFFGYDESVVLTHPHMRSHIHPDDRRNIVEPAFEKAMQTGIYEYEARIVRNDGNIHWIKTQGKVIYGENHKPVRMLGIMTDITEQKNAQMALAESEERYKKLALELEMRVQERTHDLQEANQNLERSNKELEQFAFVTSHDLQEPLRKIQTFANFLYERNKDQLNETSVAHINKMINAAQRMSRLINDLLNFSRLRRIEEKFERTDLNTVLNNILGDFELVINQKKAQITVTSLPVIEAIPLQMNQLFYNLISNALKFSDTSKAPVIVVQCRLLSEEELSSFSGLNRSVPYYEITIQDNGIGFDEVYSNKIFEIFQRLNDRTSYEGTGIGLALCNKIVLNHNGTIYAHSKEKEGSRFYVILPEKQL